MTATILQPQVKATSPQSGTGITTVSKPLVNEGLNDGSPDKGVFANTMEQALESYNAEDVLGEDSLLTSEDGELLPLDGNNLPTGLFGEAGEFIDPDKVVGGGPSMEIRGEAEAAIEGENKLLVNDLMTKKESLAANVKIDNTDTKTSPFEAILTNPSQPKDNLQKRDVLASLSNNNVDVDSYPKTELAKQVQVRNELLVSQEPVREIPPQALIQNKASAAVPVVKIAENIISAKNDVRSVAITEETLSNVNISSALKTDGAPSVKGLLAVSIASPYTSNAWSDELSGTVRYLVSKNIQHAEIKINPQNLGPIEIKISMTNEQTNVQFLSQFPQVREVLEQAMPRLRDMMGESGVVLGDVDVSQHSFNNNQNEQEKLNSELQNSYFSDENEDVDSVITTAVNVRVDSIIDYYV